MHSEGEREKWGASFVKVHKTESAERQCTKLAVGAAEVDRVVKCFVASLYVIMLNTLSHAEQQNCFRALNCSAEL